MPEPGREGLGLYESARNRSMSQREILRSVLPEYKALNPRAGPPEIPDLPETRRSKPDLPEVPEEKRISCFVAAAG